MCCCCCCHHHHCQELPRAVGLLLLLLLSPLVLVSSLEAAAMGASHCDNIYKGFAECLIRLGDSMGHRGELEIICRSWNDFHTCASQVLSGCPKKVAAVWESLHQEARRVPHPYNLHTLCDAPVHVWKHDTGLEANQETLWVTAPAPTSVPAPLLVVAALAFICLLGLLA